MKRNPIRTIWLLATLLLLGNAATAAQDPDVPAQARISPSDLAQRLSSATAGTKPLILQVGSRVLYAQAHIPGAEYVGAAGQEAGLKALVARVQSVQKDQPIVIYCGCCPWVRCPNIRVAYHQLQVLGFTRVQALYIADDFGTNWVSEGFPVEKGRPDS